MTSRSCSVQKSIAGIDVEEDAVNLYYFLKAKSTVSDLPPASAAHFHAQQALGRCVERVCVCSIGGLPGRSTLKAPKYGAPAIRPN